MMTRMHWAMAAAAVLAAGCATVSEPAEDEMADAAAAEDMVEAEGGAASDPAAIAAAETPDSTADDVAEAGVRVEPPFDGLRTNQAVIDLIKEEEGLRLEAYQGPSGKWLIGYGHGGSDVSAGKTITEAEAEALLRQDLAVIEGVIKEVVTVPLNAAELSAMVDLAYNIGTGNFRQSSVLRYLNQGDRAQAAESFLLWNKVTINGVKQVSSVLADRREVERAIFLGEETS
ncbi:MAG: lysozyme [Caulobacterales bacterium]|nr:lysozyme [Caulobacterales bacterium]